MSGSTGIAASLDAEHALLAEANATQAERNKQFVIQHFDDFVNKRDLGAIDRNMTPDFLDHDGPGGRPTDRDGDHAMMAGIHTAYPGLRVEVQSAVAKGDLVVVRNVWTGTDGPASPCRSTPSCSGGSLAARSRNGGQPSRLATNS